MKKEYNLLRIKQQSETRRYERKSSKKSLKKKGPMISMERSESSSDSSEGLVETDVAKSQFLSAKSRQQLNE